MLIPTRYALAVSASVLVIAGCTAVPSDEREAIPVPPTRTEPAASIEDAAARCGIDGSEGVELNTDGSSLSIDTKGPRESSGADITAVKCVLTTLEVPQDIQSMMKLTTSTAEPRNASWDGRDFSWNYDPETHFRLTINQS